MKAEEIKTKADVDKWLAALGPLFVTQGCQLLAYRHSLRLLPFLVQYVYQDEATRDRHTRSLLLVFRAILLSLAHLRSEGPKPKLGLEDQVSEDLYKAHARINSSDDGPERVARLVIKSVWLSTSTLQTVNDKQSRRIRVQAIQAIETGEALASLTGVTVNEANRKTINAVKYDTLLFEKDHDVLAAPLWPDSADPLSSTWLNARAFFDAHPAWVVFRDFYEHSVSGDPQDWQLLTDLGSEPDDFWTGTDEEVLGRVQAVVDNTEGLSVKSTKKPEDDSLEGLLGDKVQEMSKLLAQSQLVLGKVRGARVDIEKFTKSSENKITELRDDLTKKTTEWQTRIEGKVQSEENDRLLRQPVELWEKKEGEHRKSAKDSYKWFLGSLIATGVFIGGMALAIVNNASFLLQAIAPLGCDPVNAPQACSGFSFLGAVMIGLVLTLVTLFFWFTRLQMKEYLSERHLALDAPERRAFAEFYIGLLRQEGVDSNQVNEQRAIIYAALFRPTIDGIVKEEGGLDPALTAALSRFLAK